MADEISKILKGLEAVTNSMNGMQNEFVGLKTQHSQTATSVEKLTGKVDELNESVIRMEGKTKGLSCDVQRIENSFHTQLQGFKEEQLPLILEASFSRADMETQKNVMTSFQNHEDRFVHKSKKSTSSTEIEKPSIDGQIVGNHIAVPRWLFYAGIFFGVSAIAGGAVLAKFLF